ncbi:uncharacterized protein LOC120214692 [Hibiscus syriacus]|uniref:uncharacterized protein LOC120214692 n=1 Tax=Hibiscus syriacus TaxID=106335 RepID=UPI001921FEA1|nr:uncharacterized protein LOC120214692 [Hibiscus syriacus]
MDLLRDIVNYSLPEDAALFLTKEVSNEEIRLAIFQQAWGIVGADFTLAVRHFFDPSSLLHAFSATVIVLVPKTVNVSSMKEFRLISCCNVVYRTITRILVKRLGAFFPAMIAPNQSAFVKGRSIVDNTLLAQELVKGYVQKSQSPRCAVKIDLQKAFDSIDRNFVLAVLRAINLLDKFVE